MSKAWNTELSLENTTSGAYTSDTVSTVSIVSLIEAKISITGTVTGKVYVFERAGTVREVDILDKDEILNKKKGRACCGGTSGNAIFQLA